MKNISIALNVILLAAVTVLFVKVYSMEKMPAPAPLSVAATQSKIVFLNSDSLMEHYDLFTKSQARMEKKKDSVDLILNSRGKALEKEIQEYQEKAAEMSTFERQTREESLMKRQQDFVSYRENLMDQMKKEEAELSDSIHSDLITYLKEFNKSHGYDYILGYSRGGGVLLASDSLDVTIPILKGLNSK
ncbi:hypothetical protein BH11BAC2_BH11BAC2_20880 [soil metagenome]